MDDAVAAARSVVERYEFVKEGEFFEDDGKMVSSSEEEEEAAVPTLREAYRAMWKKGSPKRQRKKLTSWKLPMAPLFEKDFELPADVYLDAASSMRAERFRERKTRTLEVAMNEFEAIRKNVVSNECAGKKSDEQPSACGCDETSRCADSSSCSSRAVLVECTSSTCRLGKKCLNRRLQRQTSSNRKLKVAPAGRKGFGLFAAESFDTGTLVGEYLGEVMSTSRYQKLSESRRDEKHTYFMRLGPTEVIDASRKAGLCRFLNHSCQPNCEAELWTVNGERRVAVVTTQPVPEGHEFTFDYDWADGNGRCFCGHNNCRGALGKNHQQQQTTRRRRRSSPVFSSSSDEEDDDDEEDAAPGEQSRGKTLSESFKSMIQSWQDEAVDAEKEEAERRTFIEDATQSPAPVVAAAIEQPSSSPDAERIEEQAPSERPGTPEEEEEVSADQQSPASRLKTTSFAEDDDSRSDAAEAFGGGEEDKALSFDDSSAVEAVVDHVSEEEVEKKVDHADIFSDDSGSTSPEREIVRTIAKKPQPMRGGALKLMEDAATKTESAPRLPSKVTVDASKRRAAYLERVAQLNAIKEPVDGRRVASIHSTMAKYDMQDPPPPPLGRRDPPVKSKRRRSYDSSDSDEVDDYRQRPRPHFRREEWRRRSPQPRQRPWSSSTARNWYHRPPLDRDRSPPSPRRRSPPSPRRRSSPPRSRAQRSPSPLSPRSRTQRSSSPLSSRSRTQRSSPSPSPPRSRTQRSPPRREKKLSRFSNTFSSRRREDDLPSYRPVSGLERERRLY